MESNWPWRRRPLSWGCKWARPPCLSICGIAELALSVCALAGCGSSGGLECRGDDPYIGGKEFGETACYEWLGCTRQGNSWECPHSSVVYLFDEKAGRYCCNDTCVTCSPKGFEQSDGSPPAEPGHIKIDFLWVVENSSSMCQEQASLAESFDTFIEQITGFVNIDYRIAAVSTSMEICDKNGDCDCSDHNGKFRHQKRDKFPFACREFVPKVCYEGWSPDPCKVDPKLGPTWTCESPNEVSYIENPNCCDETKASTHPQHACTCDLPNPDLSCSVNSMCFKQCKSAEDCDKEFVSAEQATVCKTDPSACRYDCVHPFGADDISGCVRRPENQACPDELPLWLDNSNAKDLFKCNAIVGVEQTSCANLEQPLNAALFALDKDGPNSQQAREFIRDEAYLVVIFVGDEDDCSTDDGKKIPKEDYATCAFLGDTVSPPYGSKDPNARGPLRPVAEFVNRIKNLKPDPARVFVAAITGDSTRVDASGECGADCQTEGQCYLSSKVSKVPHAEKTYVCASKVGKADYGRRTIELVSAFGKKNGIATNICSDIGVGPALQKIAERIIAAVTSP